MSKYGTDERGWPLVPCDPAAIPEGFEPVRVGQVKEGESIARIGCDVIAALEWKGGKGQPFGGPFLIIRPIPKPIRLPLAIVPSKWWVTKDESGQVWTHKRKPVRNEIAWVNSGQTFKLPPWIAAQLPQEWHDLPWDKSAVQQTEGGER